MKGKEKKKGKGERNVQSSINQQPRTHPHEGHFFWGTSGRPLRISTSQENINC